MTDDHLRLTEQPEPDAKCPKCGGEPNKAIVHTLSANGYLHDDQKHICTDCGHRWTHGVPIGVTDGTYADGLRCDQCAQHDRVQYGLVHRIQVKGDDRGKTLYNLHMKCPECYHFWHELRRPDGNATALVGYPQITGDTENAERPNGYESAEDI